jgi:hypothetical protein
MVYYCPKGCHVTDQNKGLCPTCGELLKSSQDGSKDAILEDIGQMQRESAQDAERGRYVKNHI